MRFVTSLATALMLSTAAFAHGVTVGDLEIIHPHIPAPAATAKSAGGFMGIANDGSSADRLLGVESAFAKQVMLHTTDHGADGVAAMRHVEAVDIPAGETVLLERGGLHVMFMGLTTKVAEGDMVPATLIFEKAGRVEVEFMVDPPNGAAHEGMDHGTMDHGSMDHGAAADGPMSTAGLSDPDAISALLKAQFDRADAPLTVAPITVQGTVAVAGWSQDGQAGRAFLRKDTEGWFVEVCAGESLMHAATFVSMGLSQAEADLLAAAVNGAEAGAGAELVARLNSFEGTVVIGRASMAGHGHGAAHGTAHGAASN